MLGLMGWRPREVGEHPWADLLGGKRSSLFQGTCAGGGQGEDGVPTLIPFWLVAHPQSPLPTSRG